MVLFSWRLEELRKAAIEYIIGKLDERQEIRISRTVALYKDGDNYTVDEDEYEQQALSDLEVEYLCELADRIHTLPVKDLKP